MAHKLSKRSPRQLTLAPEAACTALYLRVSTDPQAEEGYSLDAQRAKLSAYCQFHDWQVADDAVYIDAGISGTSTEGRSALEAMLATAQAGRIQRIVAVKLDRLARNVRDFLAIADELKAVGCDLVLMDEDFDTGTATGKFALTLFAAMAELEASTITARVMTGKRQEAQVGGYNGGRVPLGYDYDDYDEGSFVPNAHAATVRYLLSNGFYAGLAQYDGTECRGDQAAIIAPELYEAAHTRLQALHPGPLGAGREQGQKPR